MSDQSYPFLYSIKMRASREENDQKFHISGAERIVLKKDLPALAYNLTLRALEHSKGEPSNLNLKIEQIDPKNCIHLKALPVKTLEFTNPQESFKKALELLAKVGLTHSSALTDLVAQMSGMRGAMLVEASSYKRLETDFKRGVRVTYMDSYPPAIHFNSKNHYEEALVLASKVAGCPYILAEFCISDDPNYTTGYVAAKELGYLRLTSLKEIGDPKGGRIFFFQGNEEQLKETLDYLEKQPVLIEGIQPLETDINSCLPQKQNLKNNAKWEPLTQHLKNLKQDNLLRTIYPLSTKPYAQVWDENRSYILLASNDYLGLAGDPRVAKAAAQASKEYGTGSGGSRLTTGSLKLHSQLEAELASFKEAESCILFNTGYMANLGTIQAIAKSDWVILSDRLNHASIIDGCRLSGAKIIVYEHNDMQDLRTKAKRYQGQPGLIVSDAVFSMDGDILHYPEFLAIAKKYGFFSMVDEAHATGVLGAHGRGICEYFGLKESADITVGTLSKALGSEGGFVVGRHELIKYLQNCARSFIFSTSLSPAPLAAALKSLDLLSHDSTLVAKLQANRAFLAERLAPQIKLSPSGSAIIPIIIGDEAKALQLAQFLRQEGCFIQAIRWPSVAKGQARIRCTVRSDHHKEDLVRAADLIKKGLAGLNI